MAIWRKWRTAGVAAAALAACACGQIPPKGSGPRAMEHFAKPPQPGAVVVQRTQGQRLTGPSIRHGAQQKPEAQRGRLTMDGTLPSSEVKPPSRLASQPEARGGGQVAYVPGVPTRRGFGFTARNGSNMERRGDVIVRRIDYTDPRGPQEAASGGTSGVRPPSQPGVGGSGTSGTGGSGKGGTGGGEKGGAGEGSGQHSPSDEKPSPRPSPQGR